jgi:hypothetical protein
VQPRGTSEVQHQQAEIDDQAQRPVQIRLQHRWYRERVDHDAVERGEQQRLRGELCTQRQTH